MEECVKEERTLTPQEEKRKAHFMKIQEEMLAKGYKGENLIVGTVKANIMAVVVTIPIMLLCLIVYKIFYTDSMQSLKGVEFTFFVIVYMVSIPVHEFIHGLTWGHYCEKGWDAIQFGVIWKYITPYCTCDECLSYKQYKWGALMPTLILGGISYILALLLGSDFLFKYSLLMILSGGGDIYMTFLIRRHKEAVFIDHPYLIGCMAFKKDA